VPLTKADIDGLVEGMVSSGRPLYYAYPSKRFTEDSIREALYLAAGLTATGERKPERVRGWLVTFKSSGNWQLTDRLPSDTTRDHFTAIPGTFVPDES